MVSTLLGKSSCGSSKLQTLLREAPLSAAPLFKCFVLNVRGKRKAVSATKLAERMTLLQAFWLVGGDRALDHDLSLWGLKCPTGE